MQKQEEGEAAALDRLIADLVRASCKVSRHQARWESDEQARSEERAARAALCEALERQAPAAATDAEPVAASEPTAEWIRTRDEGEELVDVAGVGRFHLERMSANNWWLVLEAEGRRVDVWLRAGGRISATFESEEAVNGESNSTNDAAEVGSPGLEGSITIEPGDSLPLVPRHLFKAFADVTVTSRLGVDVDLVAVGGSYARGNENNRHEPDGTFYFGDGAVRATRW